MTARKLKLRNLIFVCALFCLGACSTAPRVTQVQDLSPSADAPYENVLVVALFDSFDARRFFEKEIVKQLGMKNIKATASTSMMNTKTPLTGETFVKIVDELGSDAVLVTRILDLETATKKKDRKAEATRNFRPTYYYNVWNYELTEYVQPQGTEYTHSLVVATQLYSVLTQEPVWAIETKSKIVEGFEDDRKHNVIKDEATAITSRLLRERLVAPE